MRGDQGKNMPIYEYICQDCRTEFDALRSMSEADNIIACSHCQGENTSRKISVFFARSDGRVITQSAPSCGSCAAASCSTCGVKQ